MIFRTATSADIPEIMNVRRSVRENVLNTPGLVTDQDCEEYLNHRGKGWVCEVEGRVVGFSIADLQDHNIWALFVRPEYAGKGIGKKLHDLMLDWYFSQTREKVWLGTAPGTRAEKFYALSGWTAVGMHKSEVKFEMSFGDWQERRRVQGFGAANEQVSAIKTIEKMNFTPFPYLETDRLQLRHLEKEDENALFLLRSDEKVNAYVDRPKAETIEDVRAFIRKIDQAIARNESLYWAITLKNSAALLGSICLWNFSPGREKAELGYELLPEAQGKGIMQEALPAVVEYAFAVLKLRLIEACPHADNARSIRLLQRNNFVLESIMDEPYASQPGSYPLAVYSRRNSAP